MKVRLPTPLAEYTGNRRDVEGDGADLAALFHDLDRRHPGMRFRIVDERGAVRPHIKIFVNRASVAGLDVALLPTDEVLVVAALSGG